MKRISQTQFEKTVINCVRCPRLRKWCDDVGLKKIKRFQHDKYWCKPVPSFGKFSAQLFILGLAPAAHGANRTGRMFTGDNSGLWLYRALHEFGFATQSLSESKKDGLKLINCYISALARCAPPQNKLNRDEINNCIPFLETELSQMRKVKVFLALGKTAFDELKKICRARKWLKDTKVNFGHAECFELTNNRYLISSYHPSQQNTFTKRLTKEMFDSIFEQISELIEK